MKGGRPYSAYALLPAEVKGDETGIKEDRVPHSAERAAELYLLL